MIYIKGTRLSIAIFSVLLNASSITAQTSKDQFVGRLLDVLELRESLVLDKFVRFEYELYVGLNALEPTDPRKLGEHFAQRVEGSLLTDGKRYRQVRTTIDAAGEYKFAIGITQTLTWDGIQSRDTYRKAGDPGLKAAIRGAPSASHVVEPNLPWLGWVHLGSDFMTLSDLVRHAIAAETLVLEEQNDKKISWSFLVEPHRIRFLIVIRRANDTWLLDMLEIQAFSSKRPKSASYHSITRIDFYENDDGSPQSARIYKGVGFGEEAPEQLWNVVTLELIERADNEFESPYHAAIDPPFRLIDERYDIAYASGSRQINVDGRILRTNRDLTDDSVGDNLSEWVKNGEWEKLESTVATQQTLNKFEFNPVAILFISCGALLFSIWVFRLRKG